MHWSFWRDNTTSYFVEDPTATTVYDIVPDLMISGEFFIYMRLFSPKFSEQLLDIFALSIMIGYILSIILMTISRLV